MSLRRVNTVLAATALAAGLALGGTARANEICQAEFQPLVTAHQEVMKETQAGMPRGRPTTFEQAKANAERACRLLTNARASFLRLQQWMQANAEFCRLPDQIINDVNTGVTNITRNRTQACNGVAQLERQRRQAEAGGGGGANPFAPNAGRRPQLDLRTPGAL
ncbi:hypothetical protein [Phreatobacter oligotrophus]|jgi:hypothetical protein|uniref:UrcA family protein n=1 Tax=Phreatobacter oligotrophus TaxID=1122261 RepID=A0A2T4ZGU5_9HYPH|nr:hypothetical protein [Phreatobacter oligotrophus]PTM61144.1 hypothetical protein C8P69_102531 [Phreatobacter oligotrophus]